MEEQGDAGMDRVDADVVPAVLYRRRLGQLLPMIPSGAAHNNLARPRELLTPRNSGDPGI
jgi:hypothetical protein